MRAAVLMAIILAVGMVSSVEAYSADVCRARGWLRERTTEGEFSCAHVLWDVESSWNPRSQNRYSGAYGIPQSLPGSKMAAAEHPRWGREWDDWRTDALVQVAWGRNYVRGRYGGFCAALAYQRTFGWY